MSYGDERERERTVDSIAGSIFARSKLVHLAATCVMLAASTALGVWFHALGFADASIISLYILSTLLVAVVTTGRLCTLLSSVLSVVLYNFYFVNPLYSLESLDKSYLVTFAIMFITAIVASELTSHIARNARQAERTAFRTGVLLDTNQLLQGADGFEGIARIAMGQLVKLLAADVVFYPVTDGGLGEPLLSREDEGDPEALLRAESERDLAASALDRGDPAGAAGDDRLVSRCLYLPVKTADTAFGVVGIARDGEALDPFERSVAMSIIGECALAFAREREARDRQEAAVLARNEKLRADLLRSIGHDLRTPLAAISGSAAILRDDDGRLEPAQRRELAGTIYGDSLWLIDTMENLLTVTRIEDGTIKPNLSLELVDDVVSAAIAHMTRHDQGHPISFEPSDGFLFARMDSKLVVQLLSNLIGNAVKYTPEGTPIAVSVCRAGSMVCISVADEGPGVPDAEKSRIFDSFYTSDAGVRPVDAHRSFGLGLSLCRSIAEAHGGSIEVGDNVPHGAVFTFSLPAEEVTIHE